MRIPHLLVAAAAAVILAGCTAAPPAPPLRSAPDQVERDAVASAQVSASFDGVVIDDSAWTQLWTPTSGAGRIARCIHDGTDGAARFLASPAALSSSGLSYSIEVLAPDSDTSTTLGAGRRIQHVVDGCIARYPIDFRLPSVPRRDRAALYGYDLTFLRRCLIAHGQRVPRLPDRTRFENMLNASAPWNAYDLVVVKDRSAWYALADACPALPLAIAGDVAAITTAATTP